MPDLPARNDVLFCDTPNDTRQAAWAAVGIALAYGGMEIEVRDRRGRCAAPDSPLTHQQARNGLVGPGHSAGLRGVP